jgi:hypothetical protein
LACDLVPFEPGMLYQKYDSGTLDKGEEGTTGFFGEGLLAAVGIFLKI